MSENATALLDRPYIEQTDPENPNGVYVAAVPARLMFADRNYQRDLDETRAEKMAANWDLRKLGAIHVSDRGEDRGTDRYAIVDGQHRWAAALLRDPDFVMVANVHIGLSPCDEAKLFHEIDAATRHLSPWDKWKARRGSGDQDVLAIEAIVGKAGMRVAMQTKNGNVRSIATLEKIYRLGGKALLENTLSLIVDIWGRRTDAVDGPLMHGLALILHTYGEDLDHDRLGQVLIEFVPRHVKVRATALRETQKGEIKKLAAIVMLTAYNDLGAPKLDLARLDKPAKEVQG